MPTNSLPLRPDASETQRHSLFTSEIQTSILLALQFFHFLDSFSYCVLLNFGYVVIGRCADTVVVKFLKSKQYETVNLVDLFFLPVK